MVCVCKNALTGLIPKLSPLAGLNAGISPSMAAGLGGAVNAALSPSIALSPNLALAANLGLNANLSALGSLSALANFCGNMLSAFGIDMASPGAPLQLSQLFNSIVSNALNDMLAQLPLGATPQLGALADLGAAAGLGINPLSPNALAQLNGAADLANKLGLDLAASLGLSPSIAANLAAQLNAMLGAQAALNTGLGLNLGALGLPGLNALGASLGTIGANINALNAMLPPLSLDPAFLQKVKDFFDKLNAANKSLNTDLSLPSNWKGLSEAISGAATKSEGWSPSASGTPSAAASLSAQQSVYESAAFNQMVSGLPAIPSLANLLAALMNSIFSATGTRVVQHSPCGPMCFLMPMLPPGCLCPKMSKELSLKPSLKFNFKPTAKFTPTATATDPKDMLKVSATNPEDVLRVSATNPEDMVKTSTSTSASHNVDTRTQADATGVTGGIGPGLGIGGRRLRRLRLGRKGPSKKEREDAERNNALAEQAAQGTQPQGSAGGEGQSAFGEGASSERAPLGARVTSPRLRGRSKRDSGESASDASGSTSKPRRRRPRFRRRGRR